MSGYREDIENPFSDESHVRGASGAGNPWGGGAGGGGDQMASVRNYQQPTVPARPVTPQQQPSQHSGGGFKTATTTNSGAAATYNVGGGMSSREADLERREAELRHREARLAEKESQLGEIHKPNFPPFYPMVYHNINEDIPEQGRWLVKRLYAAFFLSVAAYLANFVAAFALLITKAESAGGTFGLALIIFLVGTPVSWVFWYSPLYKGVKNDRSIQFFFFFFNYACHLAVSALLAVGIPGWGGAGVIYTLSQIGSQLGSGILCAIASTLLIFEVVYGLWQIKAVTSYYRSRGLTAEQAKQQAIAGVASSGVGRELAGAAIKSSLAADVRA